MTKFTEAVLNLSLALQDNFSEYTLAENISLSNFLLNGGAEKQTIVTVPSRLQYEAIRSGLGELAFIDPVDKKLKAVGLTFDFTE